ncbi:BA14K family protein [Pseudoflavitalea sp. G-6-1-2]|nr:BA14K family protein [Pseudoflavitalea sp. G-6-1-2]
MHYCYLKFSIYTPSDGTYTPYSGSTKKDAMEPVIITFPRKKKTSN